VERYFVLFSKMAFILLAVWVILAGLGYTSMPGTVKQAVQRTRRHRAKGNVWASGFVTAPSAEDSLSFPAAPVM
jgi:hypothetical protein